MNLEIKDITKYNEKKWVLNLKDRHILINEHTYKLITILQKGDNLASAHALFQDEYKLQINFDDFIALLKNKLGEFNIIQLFDSGEKAVVKPLKKVIPFLYKIQVLNSSIVGKLASLFVIFFNIKLFYWIFGITYFLLFEAYFIYQPSTDIRFKTIEVLPILIITFFSSLVHELGHIAACRKFGIGHGGIGFAFYYILPVFYADVANVWEAEKGRRIIVNLGGIYIQIIVALALFFVFYITQYPILLYASYLFAFSATFQLIPFIRLDGYWLLSDITETPNLLSNSNLILKKYFTILFNFTKSPKHFTFATDKRSIILFFYGILNNGLIFSYIAWVLTNHFKDILYFPQTIFYLLEKLIQSKFIFADLEYKYLLIIGLYLMIFRSIIRFIAWIKNNP